VDFEQNEDISYSFLSQNIEDFISNGFKYNIILEDCINPTETLLDGVQDVLMTKEVKISIDFDKQIEKDFIQVQSK